VRALAAALDLRPTKQRGQNFVIDANTVRRIVRASGVGDDDCVLEVGPGLGSLTLGLLEQGLRSSPSSWTSDSARALPGRCATSVAGEPARPAWCRPTP
jgi:16S rRNA (adenine1518-N6/adenine1519-N6)-dimethyltransferase